MAQPAWLPAHPARRHGDGFDLLTMPRYADMLCMRREAEWVEVSDGWEAALYAPFTPSDYFRPLHWSLVAEVLDAHGLVWTIPALLYPSDHETLPGPPTVAMGRRLTASGWSREPIDQIQQAALQACAEAFPHLSDLGSVPIETSSDWISAVLECTCWGDPLTFAKLGLIDDVLVEKGLKIACGRMPAASYDRISA